MKPRKKYNELTMTLMKKHMSQLADKVCKTMREKNLTIKDVSNHCKISIDQIKRIRSNAILDISLSNLVYLAEGLGIHPCDLIADATFVEVASAETILHPWNSNIELTDVSISSFAKALRKGDIQEINNAAQKYSEVYDAYSNNSAALCENPKNKLLKFANSDLQLSDNKIYRIENGYIAHSSSHNKNAKRMSYGDLCEFSIIYNTTPQNLMRLLLEFSKSY